jgi:hypothetical protein
MKFIHKYLNIIIILLSFITVSGCSVPQYMIVNTIVNNCIEPAQIEYFAYNDEAFNKEIDILVQKWPEHLREYIHLKINNRIIQHERCISYTEEQKVYQRCLLSLIEETEND